MDIQKITLRFAVITALIFSASFCRMIPHMPNFSPLAAIGLFGAAHFVKKWQAFLIPIAATWLSDLFINNIIYGQYYPKFTWFYAGFYWQYGSYLLITLAGIFIFKKVNAKRVIAGVITSTAIFFLVSNFGSWIDNSTYPQNFGGLITCYIAGIPFLKGTLLGDVCYSAILFGSFALAQLRFPVLRIAYLD
ncbi:DUF6580 family putative transport protein [Mucilaginibacter sp. FT3.2]|uniref:DUF6580 family putative transport protein n=1 Tax=Mucilaginibacter sp. FT3.2 TaxID=2723090 RepID=UPI0017B87010|nr:DUF6580 family putative transport protein [Mucilaginibacter sp. FT3.2]MBB6232914.1 hypothetical protein [Mucilaginibacter sp. FT3.2]